jgi:hypothetical protein
MAKVRTFIEFFYPGVFVDETSVKEVSSRDIKGVNVPQGAFGFIFFDVMSTKKGGVKMKSKRLNISPMYFYGGRIMTLAEVRREMPSERILIDNMEGNGLVRVIRCRTSNFKPFEENDVYIAA